MAISATNPFASGGSSLGSSFTGIQQMMQGLKPKRPEDEQMYGMAQPQNQGKAWEGFNVPKPEGTGLSFMSAGDNSGVYGQDGSIRGSKLNVIV
jgi:hypothetical protein